jgi:hypothetical protein
MRPKRAVGGVGQPLEAPVTTTTDSDSDGAIACLRGTHDGTRQARAPGYRGRWHTFRGIGAHAVGRPATGSDRR